MIRLICGFLLLLQVCQAASPESIRIVSWNVQNYLLQNRYIHGAYRFQYPKPEAEKAGMRALLLRERPDILCLQELGSQAFLRELRADLAASGLSYGYTHWAQVPDARTGLAVLSRFPLETVIFHDPVPVPSDLSRQSMPRGIQEIHFSVQGHAIHLFHVHIKSRYSSDPDDPESRRFRTAELAALAAFLQRSCICFPDQPFCLVAGDFNTPFSSELLAPLRANWTPVPAADSSGQDWTYHFHKNQATERIDGFWIRQDAPPLVLSARVLAPPNPSPSDHRPVLLQLYFPTPPH